MQFLFSWANFQNYHLTHAEKGEIPFAFIAAHSHFEPKVLTYKKKSENIKF